MSNFEVLCAGIATIIVAGMPALLAILKINKLHILVNSRLSQLIETTAIASRAEGKVVGKVEARRDQDAEDDRVKVLIEQEIRKSVTGAKSEALTIIAEASREAKMIIAEATREAKSIAARDVHLGSHLHSS